MKGKPTWLGFCNGNSTQNFFFFFFPHIFHFLSSAKIALKKKKKNPKKYWKTSLFNSNQRSYMNYERNGLCKP